MEFIDLSGLWQCDIPGQRATVRLPGTLDENGVGHPDAGTNQWHPDESGNAVLQSAGVIATRLTRRFTYEGPAAFSRALCWTPPQGKRVFLECERSRCLSLRVNGAPVPPFVEPSLSTPHVFEVTGLLTGDDLLTLVCDNSYPGWPREDIVYSSAATDETQTNWNGLLGYLRLRVEEPVFLHALRVYPRGGALDVCADVSAQTACEVELRIDCEALEAPVRRQARLAPGLQEVRLAGLPLQPSVQRWDEADGRLYELTAALGASSRTVRLGIRDFGAQGGHLQLNGRNIFLRGEANCAVFPETGHPPMDAASWRQILSVYRSYGVNCMRFHSHCPPQAAFEAADEMGMMMQPELSHWNPRDAFTAPQSRAYYRAELEQTLRMLANHPSFVMLSLGNELQADEAGHAFMAQLMDLARSLDPTRLYATGSNNHYGQRGCDDASDFYTSSNVGELDLRATNCNMQGWLNRRYPDLCTDYTPAVDALRKGHDQPVFSFEVGQFEVLPDFDGLDGYRGVTDPANLRLVRDKVEQGGLMPIWKRCVEASGELALLCYRAEVEAALRTPGMSGISLLGLQDFPGQGTALVGMLDPHLKPKPYAFARPERFARFFTGELPLALLPKCTYQSAETLRVRLRMANYGRVDLHGAPVWSLEGAGLQGELPAVSAPAGGLTDLGELALPLAGVTRASRLTLRISLCGRSNEYPIWVYPDERPVCPANVHECRALDDAALDVLAHGGTVYLAPDSTPEALPHSIQGQFSTDFWSVGTFAGQEGGMGQLIDAAHPLFEGFPTECHTDWQWWPMAGRRAAILPRPMQAIVAELDSYAYLRPMAQLLECRCGGGRVLLSTLGLHALEQYPEARALQGCIYRYLGGRPALPQQEMTVQELRAIVRPVR